MKLRYFKNFERFLKYYSRHSDIDPLFPDCGYCLEFISLSPAGRYKRGHRKAKKPRRRYILVRACPKHPNIPYEQTISIYTDNTPFRRHPK